ncbi:MAG: Adaptive-response sensory-kinase SasA [Planctomycetes bacterium]|nr:Adaptive-response sensory-kinase SasA [Planctomycetota bacterium]
MTLRFKLFGAIGAILCVVLGVMVILTLVRERSRANRDRETERALLDFAAGLASPADLVAESALVSEGRLHPRIAALGIYDARPEETSAAPSRSWGALLRDAEVTDRAAEMVAEVWRTGRPIRRGWACAVPTIRPGAAPESPGSVQAVAYVELRASEEDEPARAGRVQFILVLCAGGLLMLTTWWIVERVVVARLRAISAGADRVAHGDYSRPVEESGRDDEIERVVRSFNGMMVEFAQLEGKLKEEAGEAIVRARQTQDSLVLAQRLAATGRLAAGIAHEVNNPLAGMLNAVHSLRTKEMTPERRAEYLALVEEGLLRIQATVAKILRFRPHKVAPRGLAVEEVVRPVLALAGHRIERQGVEAVVEGDGSAPVFGDPYELQQALLNVILNALDALEAADRRDQRISIRVDADDREVRITVTDNGTGMRDEDLSRAFDLFFTTKEPGKGTGLGLAMVHKIVTDHGGRIALRNADPGPGLEVSIALPRFSGAS